MNGRWIAVVLLVVLLAVGAVALGTYAYNIGMAQGLAQSDKLPTPGTGVAPWPFYGPYLYRPFGFGFGILGCLFPLFFFLLFFGLLRGIFWGGHWGWRGRYGMREGHVPPMFEEWHRKMHEDKPAQP